jgi:signal transduction histidine kinase
VREGGERQKLVTGLAMVSLVLSAVALALVARAATSGSLPVRPGWPAALALAAFAAGSVALGRALGGAGRARRRAEFLAETSARLQAAHGFARTMALALQASAAFLRARSVALVATDSDSTRSVLWQPAPVGRDVVPAPRELLPDEAACWLFEMAGGAWHARRRDGGRWEVVAVAENGSVLPAASVAAAGLAPLGARLGAGRLTVVAFGRGREWAGRLVLADAEIGPPLEGLRFVQRMVQQLGGVIQARFLLGRLRSRVGAMERARIARELHDGTIQALVGVQMELEVLQRRALQRGSPMAEDLVRVQQLLRGEIVDLRDTMQRLKPIEIEPLQLVGFLDQAVARFERDSGIHSLFDCTVADADLSPRVCRELARIVLEALHNVRKHSGARHVVVRFGPCEPGGFRLVVDDDGRGFGAFSGTLTHAELDLGRKGPYVIKERVRALGGELTITTSAGGGARLEIRLPREEP